MRQMNIEQIKDIVLEAGTYLKNREAATHITVKGASDYVTEVDKSVQSFIQKALQERYPEVQFLGEEKNNDEIDFSGRVWVLDPVDGTTNLIHDYKRSSISLALMENGRTILGIVYQPYTEEMFYAEKGKGAFLNGRQIHVSRAQTMDECMFAFGTAPYEKEKYGEAWYSWILRISAGAVPRRSIWRRRRRAGSTDFLSRNSASGIMRREGFWCRKQAAGRRTMKERNSAMR